MLKNVGKNLAKCYCSMSYRATEKTNIVCHRKQSIKAYANGDTYYINPYLGKTRVFRALLRLPLNDVQI